MTAVKCIECKHARWETTATGEVKPLSLGKCEAVIPRAPSYICVRYQGLPPKRGIWPKSAGACEAFELIEVRQILPGQVDMGEVWEVAQ